MSDVKISAETSVTSLTGTEYLPVVQAGANYKATPADIKNYLLALANTWTATQTHTPAANTSAIVASGYSLTGSNAQSMIDLSGTWNTSGTPTAIKLNITDTASNASSLLMDLQVGAASMVRVLKSAYIGFKAGSSGPNIGPVGSSPTALGVFNAGLTDYANLWTSSNFVKGYLAASDHLSLTDTHGSDGDVRLYRDAAGTLAQRNSANAQKLRVYSTFTDSSNHERAAINTTAGTGIELAAETAGTGGDNLNVALTPAGTGGVTLGANYQQFTEMTAPAAGASNTVRLYAEDNGSGKTRLMALFPTGAAQQVAIEP